MNTCFHVESASYRFLIDCGTAALAGLKRYQINPAEIDAILLSHFHGDHYGGLPFFLLDAATNQRKKLLTIISPEGCRERLLKLLDLLYPGTEVLEKLNIEFITYQSAVELFAGPLSLLAIPVVHTESTLPHGLRIKVDGKVISYSGDTEWTENLLRLAENAAIFICECNFFSMEVKGHLNLRMLEEKLPVLKFKKIVLTHLGQEMLDNMDEVNMPCAFDGMVLEI